MSANYATNLHIFNGRRGPDDMTPARWHEAAIADTGDSYLSMTRAAVVQCLWCDEVFIAKTVREAVVMFRAHEDKMLNAANEARSNRPSLHSAR